MISAMHLSHYGFRFANHTSISIENAYIVFCFYYPRQYMSEAMDFDVGSRESKIASHEPESKSEAAGGSQQLRSRKENGVFQEQFQIYRHTNERSAEFIS